MDTPLIGFMTTKNRKESFMNFSIRALIMSAFILGSYSTAHAAVMAPPSATQSSQSTQEFFYPEIVAPSESEGLTPQEKEKLQRDVEDVMDQVPGY
jgi:hypothetical protein